MPRRSTTHFAQNPVGFQKPEWAERATLREEAQFKSTFFFPSLCANCSHRNEITGAKCEKANLISKSIQSICQALNYVPGI